MSTTKGARRRSTLALTAIIAALALGACTTSAARPHLAAHATPTTPTTVHHTNAYSDYGRAIDMTSAGFRPEWLLADLHTTVTFTNRTTTSQRIVFVNDTDAHGKPIDSGPIAPGGTWQYRTDDFASIVYRSAGLPGQIGKLQIMPPANP
jgi:hypothetical protein